MPTVRTMINVILYNKETGTEEKGTCPNTEVGFEPRLSGFRAYTLDC